MAFAIAPTAAAENMTSGCAPSALAMATPIAIPVAALAYDATVDKNGKISVQFKSDGKKIKTNLRLPARDVTYLRYIMDSHFIPVNGSIKKAKKGFKVKVVIG